MKALRFLMRLLIPFGGLVFLSIVLGTATITANIGLMGTSAYLIARAAEHPSIAYLEVAIVGVRLFGLTRGLFRYLERLVSHSLNFKILANLQVWIFQHLEALAPGGLVQRRGGDLLENMVEDVDVLENFYIRAVSPLLVALMVVGGVSLFIGQFAAQVGVILFLGLSFSGIALPLGIYLINRPLGQKIVRLKAEINSSMIENFQGIEDLLVYGYAGKIIERFDHLSHELGRYQMIQAVSFGLSGGANLLATQFTLWMMLYFSIPLVSNGKLDGVILAVISLIILASFEATIPLAGVAQNLEISLSAAKRILDTAEKSPPVVEAPNSQEDAGKAVHLELRNLWFRHGPEYDWALKDINLILPIGKKVALVGPSGAGKTSLAQLLIRYYPYERGQYLLNGVDVQNIHQNALRRKMTLVAQSTYLFNQSIRQNLVMANPQASETDLLESIHQVGLDDWYSQQPQGLETMPGELGTFMSGGERQRLALARALLQKVNLVIFDEPMANLDAVNARELLPALLNPVEGKSVLWITHNLIGLEKMDEIVVLKDGCIVERGNQNQLMLNKGLYWKMWTIQHELI